MISVENQICPTPVYLAPPLREFLWNFLTGVVLKKTSVMPIPDGEKSLMIYALFRCSIPECDRQTDGFRSLRALAC